MQIFYLLLFSFIMSPFASDAQSLIDALKSELSEAKSTIDSIDILVQVTDQFISSDLDSSRVYLELTRNLSERADDPYGLATYYLLAGKIEDRVLNYTFAKNSFIKSIQIADSIGYEQGSELANSALGYLYRREGKLDSSNICFEKVRDLAQDPLGKSIAINGIALNYKSVGAYKEATENFYRTLDLTAEEDHDYRSAVFLNVGMVCEDQGLNDQALKYYKVALTEAKLSEKKNELAEVLGSIGSYYYRILMYDSAKLYLQKSIKLLRENQNQYQYTNVAMNLAKVFMKQRKWEKVDVILNELESFESLDKNPTLKAKLKMLKATYLLDNPKSDFNEAYSTLVEAKNLILNGQSKFLYGEWLNIKSQILEKKSPFEALQAYRAYHHWQDSLISQNNTNYTAMLETKYESAQKDQKIHNLSQQAQIQALQISQRNTQLIGAGIALLVLILGGFAFYQQRKFKHQQAVSDMEQRMLRLQMNPHFIFNALASIQNYILQSDTKESVSYLAKFGKLMRQILEHSREEFITIEEETDMLRNYLEIQQLRFKNRFDFKIEIDPAIDPTELQIPPLFAQPFVENAIEHGLKDKTSDGLITIRFSPEGKNIRLEVEDNGSGINTTSISNKTHKSLASIISRERLEILSKRLKMEFTMEIMNKKDSSGTYASLILPALPIA
jgi:hypothetical protein